MEDLLWTQLNPIALPFQNVWPPVTNIGQSETAMLKESE